MNMMALPVSLLVFVSFVLQVTWYIAVLVLLLRIWKKVKHLPG